MNNLKIRIIAILLLMASVALVVYQIISSDQKLPQPKGPEQNEEVADGNEDEVENDKVKNEIVCTMNFDPVCGRAEGAEKSFSNQCEAEKAGASDIVEGLCSPLEACPTEKDPVCGVVDGSKTNFDNLCIAEAAGATDIEPGNCPANPDEGVVLCPEMPDPVCATLEGKKTDFENACVAQQAGATEITEGKCPLAPDPDLGS